MQGSRFRNLCIGLKVGLGFLGGLGCMVCLGVRLS